MSTRSIVWCCVVCVGTLTAANGQSPADRRLLGRLQQLFPEATSFSAKAGVPPHYRAYTSDPGDPSSIAGIAFWTLDVTPDERGYDGPINVLVGMTMRARLTGIIVVEHREPYGYFSIDTRPFAVQFAGKDIREQFRLGDDIDAVSRATMTTGAVVRAVRDGSRRVARALLSSPGNTR